MPKIAVCGHSLLLSVVAESLEKMPGIEVEHLDSAPPFGLDRITAGAPDIVLVELGPGGGESDPVILSLLHEHPSVAVIGLDAQRSVLTVLSSRQVPAAEVSDLVRLIGQLDPCQQGS